MLADLLPAGVGDREGVRILVVVVDVEVDRAGRECPLVGVDRVERRLLAGRTLVDLGSVRQGRRRSRTSVVVVVAVVVVCDVVVDVFALVALDVAGVESEVERRGRRGGASPAGAV